jgi:RNA polymerase subunit RPABC4/transcription elongation factor Spt4
MLAGMPVREYGDGPRAEHLRTVENGAISMVAKAVTKAGEYFCFHCGKQVTPEDTSCPSCGFSFDRAVRAFRCPRCAKILPSGAVVCPACGLGFKVRNVTGVKRISEDDEILVEIIDHEAQPEIPVSDSIPEDIDSLESPSTDSALKPESIDPDTMDAPEEPAPESLAPIETGEINGSMPSPPEEKAMKDGREAMLIKLDEAESDMRMMADRNKALLDSIRDQMGRKKAGGDEPSHEHIEHLENELQAGIDGIGALDFKINQLMLEVMKSSMEARRLDSSPSKEPQPMSPSGGREGLSNKALRQLLTEREREVRDLRGREEELSLREEHLKRRMREYATKNREYDSLRKRAASAGGEEVRPPPNTGPQEYVDFPNALTVDDKEGWLKEQSKIKMGLVEMRNDLGAKKNSIDYYPPRISGEMLEKIEVLEERLMDAQKERDDLSGRLRELESTARDVKELLKILDQTLGKLPKDVIEQFSKSKDFKLYEKVLDKLNI